MNKWIDPRFWEHPTPLNLFLLLIGMVFLIYESFWLVWLITCLPLSPF